MLPEQHGSNPLNTLSIKPGATAGVLILALYTLTVCAVALVFPAANWDMIAYLASVLEGAGTPAAQVHADAYELVQQNSSAGEFLKLTADRPYRIAQYADADAFTSMLGFYRVKLLYIEAAQLLSPWFGPVGALRVISAGSVICVGAMTMLWLIDQKSLAVAPIAVIALILTGFSDVARQATPDLFSALFVLAGILLYVRGHDIAAGLALLLAILVRPDHLALVGVFMVISMAIRPVSKGAIGAFVLGLIAYVVISRAADHPGWWVQFWFTNIEYVPTLEGFDPAFSLVVYGRAVVQTLVRSVVEERWLAVLALMIFLAALMLRKNFDFTRRESVALSSILLTIPAKFVILPLYADRFYFAYLIAFGLILVTIYGRQCMPVFSSELPVRGERLDG